MPVSPTGASATGMVTAWPIISAGYRALGNVDGNPLAQLDILKIGFVGAVGRLRPGARIGVFVKHARHASARHAFVNP